MKPVAWLSSAVFLLSVIAGCSGPIQTEGPRPQAPEIVSSSNATLTPKRRPLAVGDVIPQFELVDQKGIPVGDGELTAGKGSILIFLPPEPSGASRPVFEWVRRHRSFLEQQRLEVLLVTPHSVNANAAASARENLRVAFLSDPASWVARAFGAVPETSSAPVRPQIFLLGSNGRIQYAGGALPAPSDLLMAAETLPGQPRDSVFF